MASPQSDSTQFPFSASSQLDWDLKMRYEAVLPSLRRLQRELAELSGRQDAAPAGQPADQPEHSAPPAERTGAGGWTPVLTPGGNPTAPPAESTVPASAESEQPKWPEPPLGELPEQADTSPEPAASEILEAPAADATPADAPQSAQKPTEPQMPQPPTAAGESNQEPIAPNPEVAANNAQNNAPSQSAPPQSAPPQSEGFERYVTPAFGQLEDLVARAEAEAAERRQARQQQQLATAAQRSAQEPMTAKRVQKLREEGELRTDNFNRFVVPEFGQLENLLDKAAQDLANNPVGHGFALATAAEQVEQTPQQTSGQPADQPTDQPTGHSTTQATTNQPAEPQPGPSAEAAGQPPLQANPATQQPPTATADYSSQMLQHEARIWMQFLADLSRETQLEQQRLGTALAQAWRRTQEQLQPSQAAETAPFGNQDGPYTNLWDLVAVESNTAQPAKSTSTAASAQPGLSIDDMLNRLEDYQAMHQSRMQEKRELGGGDEQSTAQVDLVIEEEQAENTELPEEMITETMGRIYESQQQFELARQVYSRLKLKMPEKSSYFDTLLTKLPAH